MSKTSQTLELLRHYESRNVTFQESDRSWPIVWERAKGVHVWDPEGTRYLDLTAAFGVAAAGHANPRVVAAGRSQMGKLLHAMGDVHPHPIKAQLARELSRITFERWTSRTPEGFRSRISPTRGKTIFCNSGFEAVEAALKTAILSTRKRDIVAFQHGYHGLGYGALNVTYRDHFRGPFCPQLGKFGHFVSFPTSPGELDKTESEIQKLFRRRAIGAVLVEPIQVRGGVNIPPSEFLPLLRRICDEHGALLILDEIYTGFGRSGTWFACEHSNTTPDLICLGKALAGGFPISACIGPAGVMDAAWPASTGEAIHTSTFLGHPVGCAMALAQIRELKSKGLILRSARLGVYLRETLAALNSQFADLTISVRGSGLMVGAELRLRDGSPATAFALRAIKQMLRRGYILLPEGEHANVISFTPPLTISKRQLHQAVRVLAEVLHEIAER
ncbi:MAG: aspartate aminotransferase family protein [Verrucomicrobiota bacterium]